MTEVRSVPKVFISYSHDSAEHKQWVISLGHRLLANGVDVLLDAYDLRAGHDVPKFMERGVRDSDRVLMICTEPYVTKANAGVGGVGYETTAVSGELVRNLGTTKFIPIIRQGNEPYKVPTSVSTRAYINLSEGPNAEAEFERLLQELHDAGPRKPPVGTYRRGASAASEATPASAASAAQPSESFGDPASVYGRALHAAQSDNLVEWRQIIRGSRAEMNPQLTKWWAKYSTTAPPAPQLAEESMEGVAAFAPHMAIALAGLTSGKAKFQSELVLIEDVLNPTGWQRSGFNVRADLPISGAFVYQALHGAMSLHLGNLPAAMKLARMELPVPMSGNMVPLWQQHGMVGWPVSLGRDAIAAWKILRTLPSRWPWLTDVFGDDSEYQAALYAYYASLNALEYIERLRQKRSPLLPSAQDFRPHLPPVFESVDDDAKRRGYRLLATTSADLRALWSSLAVDERVIRSQWDIWIELQRAFIPHFYPLGSDQLGFQRLIPDVLA
jgi:TIR domain